MAVFREDAGYVGQMVSLAGVKGKEGAGLLTSGVVNDLVAVTGYDIAQVNPARKWCIVQNVSQENASASDIRIQLGTQGGFYFVLAPYGFLLINEQLPWTGAIGAYALAAGARIRVIEASVQQA